MQERYVGRLEPGMDVCDIAGDKIGTLARVYRHEMAHASSGAAPDGGVMTAPGEEVVEVKTGLLGLGKHLYVPFSTIEDVTSGCVFLKHAKKDLDQQGWDHRPDYLGELN